MPTQLVNETTFSYVERGAGPAVCLLHGFPFDSRMWEAQLSELSARHRVIAPDLRGFGKSSAVDAFTMESLADDVHALLKSIGALPCVLGGLSMGGYVALAFARKYASDLRGLILLDTRAEADSAEGKQGRQKMIDLVRASGPTAVAEQMMPKMVSADAPQKRPELVRSVRSIMDACPAATIEHALQAMRDRPDHVAALPSIAIPTLVLVGDNDTITPIAMAETMRKKLPKARLSVVHGAAHLSPMEQPAQVNQAIRQFLASIPF